MSVQFPLADAQNYLCGWLSSCWGDSFGLTSRRDGARAVAALLGSAEKWGRSGFALAGR